MHAEIEALFGGQAYGPVAAHLLANGMDTSVLRTNALLRDDEWKAFDDAIQPILFKRLRAVRALISRGLVKTIPNGLGRTVLESANIGDRSPARVSMDAAERGSDDLVDYGTAALPLPVTHAGFKLNIRQLSAGRNFPGNSVETDNAEAAARVVAESNELVLFNGVTGNFGGGTIYGLINHPNVINVSAAPWTDSGIDGGEIVNQIVRQGLAALVAEGFFGPYGIFTTNAFGVKLGEDYSSAKGDNTILQRILAINDIEFVETSSQMPADTTVIVQLDRNTIRMVDGLQPRMIEWNTEGGLVSHFKVIDILVPQIRAHAGVAGVVVIS